MDTLTAPALNASPLAAFKPDALRKAIRLVENGMIRHLGGPAFLVTSGRDGQTAYGVNAYRQECTCPAGEQGRRCYHLAAAIALFEGGASGDLA